MQNDRKDYLDEDEDLNEDTVLDEENSEDDDQDQDDEDQAPVAAPAAAPSARLATVEEVPAANPRVLSRLLAMADRYRSEGVTMQAMEMYWVLYDNHPGTEHAERAADALLDIADGFEAEGAKRMARSIYERML